MPTRVVDLTPSEGARRAAEQGLEYRRKYGRGGTPVGIARARDIKNGKTLSPSTVRRMKAFFDRHEGNRVSPAQKKESDGGPTNGWIAWLLWGGDAGRTWAEAKVRQLNAEEDRVRIRKRGYDGLSEEEKKAFKVVMGAMKKLMEEEPVEEEEYEEEKPEEERPYDEEGKKIEKQEEEEEEIPRMKKKRQEEEPNAGEEENRWINAVVSEIRRSK